MSRTRTTVVIVIGLFVAAGAGLAAGILFTRQGAAPAARSAARYYCPMHPDYRSDVPGNCPVCSMRLVPLVGEPGAPSTDMTPGGPPAAPAGPGITIPSQRLQLAGMRTAPVEATEATAVIRARGRVAPDETRIVHVHSRVSGFVEEVRAAYVGAPVRKGETLFTITSPELIATQQELLSARRAADALRSSSFEWAARDQRALVEAARQRLRLLGMGGGQIEAVERTGNVQRTIAVASEVSGVVTAREAFAHGRAVTPDLELFTVADVSVVWILAQVYERDVARVHAGQEAVIREASGSTIPGHVDFIAPFVDPATRTIAVRLEVPNAEGLLRTDALVDVELREALGRQLVVPDGAILDAGESSHAFVAHEGGSIEPRAVVPGPRVEQGRVVVSGLAEGEQVVTSAQFLVDSESQIRGAMASWGQPVGGASSAAEPALTARIETDPSPPRTGKARVTVVLTDAAGQPVQDAQVDLSLDMAAMGSMAPMRSTARLEAMPVGRYVGTVEILMPFAWSATITARRDGTVVGVAHATLETR